MVASPVDFDQAINDEMEQQDSSAIDAETAAKPVGK
jgi:hypothetical protein